MDVVASALSSAGSMKRNDHGLRTNGKYWLPLSLSSVRLRLRAVLSPSSWPPPISQRDIDGSDISAPSKFRSPIEAEQRDAISLLNERIRSEHCKRESPSSRPTMDSEEAEKYIRLVKEQQQRGLQKLKGERTGTVSGSFNYKVDPYTLRSGDYVVHKKVGIGRFVGVKFDVSKVSSEPIEYVFIEYADGMAKLPVKQASRMLYRYNL